MRPVPHSTRSSSQGFLLLEVLVAILIFSFGVLGIVGLQAAMIKAQSGSKYRADAAFLAQELVGNMWGNLGSLPAYTTGGCAGNNQCNAVKSKIAAQLPSGTLEIDQAQPGQVEITIRWTPPGEDSHKYVTAAAVRS